jgi:hypothetical protein
MCNLNPRSRLVLAKLEATEGTDAAPAVGTDDLFVSMDSAGIDNGVTVVDNDPASPTGYQLPSAIATAKPSATYRIPLYGKGLSTGQIVLPRYALVFLASCGHIDLSGGSPAGELMTWTPDAIYPRTTAANGTVTANLRTFTVYDYLARDGSVAAGTKILQAMVGARVSQIRFNLTVGQWAFMEVDVLGLYVKPTAVTTSLAAFDLDNVTTDFVRCNAAQSSLNYGGAIALKANTTSWTIDFGAAQEDGDTTNAGVACVGVRQAIVSGATNILQATADIDAFADAQDVQETGAYAMAGSMTPSGRSVDTGYTVRIAAPAVQLTYKYDTSGSAVRTAATLGVKSADGTTPPISLVLS